MSGDHFYAYMYRLRLIQRWVLMRSAVPENVAEHSYQVALLTHALCTIGREVFGTEVDTGQAVILALFHDAEEVMTGDIPSPVKHHNPGMLRSIREIESLAANNLLGMVPEGLVDAYRPLITGPERDSDLMRWVKAADALDAYLKCAMEYAAGNREFAVAERQLEAKARAMRMPEVDYFLEHFAPSFRMTLDELTANS
ncbi:MAG TPA: 5'-deoxynucleotidase [Chloroflexota bacterium]|jgi:5'-deoxynucleotidase